jgi:hypothetical protein
MANELMAGQITITTAGTAVVGTDVPGYGFFIRALEGNTGLVYVGNDGAGDVTASNGFELGTGDSIYIEVPNLNYLYFDAATNGDKVCWVKSLTFPRVKP